MSSKNNKRHNKSNNKTNEWGRLNERLIKNKKNKQWGLYKNTRFGMAEFLQDEDKLKEALREYLVVCYLSLNGPMNCTPVQNNNFEPDVPRELAPGLIERIKEVLEELNLDKEKVKKIYLDFSKKIQKKTNAPVKPIECFSKIENKIWE